MKLLVFGTGKYYKNRKSILEKYCDYIIAFIDNKAEIKDEFENKKVVLPCYIDSFDYDIILLMSKKWREMRDQLLSLGVDSQRIYLWDQYVCGKERGRFKIHINSYWSILPSKKRILIISTALDYNGGSIAAVYAAKALQNRGYDVTLAAQTVGDGFLKEIMNIGIRMIEAGGLPFLSDEELDWVRLYDSVIVNVFQMLRAACCISEIRPTLWWIHEPSMMFGDWYCDSINKFSKDAKRIIKCKALIAAVSDIARRNFEYYYPDRINCIVPYGIPDEQVFSIRDKTAESLTFVVIGSVDERKGQKIFLDAIALLPDQLRDKSKFLIVGFVSEEGYSYDIKKYAASFPQVSLLGQISRKEMLRVFECIDIVVTPSLEDPLPIVITEGWMHGKVCIMSDATGQADMTEDGVNGLVCKAGDAQALADKMTWVLQNKDKLDGIRKKGRETYEKYFSMERFGERLEQAVLAAERKFNEQRD